MNVYVHDRCSDPRPIEMLAGQGRERQSMGLTWPGGNRMAPVMAAVMGWCMLKWHLDCSCTR